VTEKTDVYSFGLCLWEILCLRQAFGDELGNENGVLHSPPAVVGTDDADAPTTGDGAPPVNHKESSEHVLNIVRALGGTGTRVCRRVASRRSHTYAGRSASTTWSASKTCVPRFRTTVCRVSLLSCARAGTPIR
jgi:hypothetical protein